MSKTWLLTCTQIIKSPLYQEKATYCRESRPVPPGSHPPRKSKVKIRRKHLLSKSAGSGPVEQNIDDHSKRSVLMLPIYYLHWYHYSVRCLFPRKHCVTGYTHIVALAAHSYAPGRLGTAPDALYILNSRCSGIIEQESEFYEISVPSLTLSNSGLHLLYFL